jgi:hypothetical protein
MMIKMILKVVLLGTAGLWLYSVAFNNGRLPTEVQTLINRADQYVDQYGNSQQGTNYPSTIPHYTDSNGVAHHEDGTVLMQATPSYRSDTRQCVANCDGYTDSLRQQNENSLHNPYNR